MIIKAEKYTKEQADIWNEFVKASKNGLFMFKRGFMDYHSDRFIDNSLMFYEDDTLIALLPASLHGKELISHGGLTFGGFIVNEKMKQHKMLKCFDELKNYMAENGLNSLIYKAIPYIYHNYFAQEDLYALFVNNARLLKLEPSCSLYLKNPYKMPKGRKAQISRAKREGVLIEPSIDFDTFINLENSVLKEHHNATAVHTADELKLLKSRFGDKIQLWVSKYNGEMIAGALLFVYENIVHTQYLAANDKAREIGGLDILIKNLIDNFSKEKTYFDFGISTEDNGRYLNEGLINQKEGFGARVVVHQTWELKV